MVKLLLSKIAAASQQTAKEYHATGENWMASRGASLHFKVKDFEINNTRFPEIWIW